MRLSSLTLKKQVHTFMAIFCWDYGNGSSDLICDRVTNSKVVLGKSAIEIVEKRFAPVRIAIPQYSQAEWRWHYDNHYVAHSLKFCDNRKLFTIICESLVRNILSVSISDTYQNKLLNNHCETSKRKLGEEKCCIFMFKNIYCVSNFSQKRSLVDTYYNKWESSLH